VVQRNCERNTNRYSEALIYNPSYIMSEVEKHLLEMLKKEYPQANIIAVDYDPGASEVNQLNRIKLMLSTAVKNMRAAQEEKNRA